MHLNSVSCQFKYCVLPVWETNPNCLAWSYEQAISVAKVITFYEISKFCVIFFAEKLFFLLFPTFLYKNQFNFSRFLAVAHSNKFASRYGSLNKFASRYGITPISLLLRNWLNESDPLIPRGNCGTPHSSIVLGGPHTKKLQIFCIKTGYLL